MKMTFNLFDRLVLWLKIIFHIHPKPEHKRRTVEVTPQPEEKSIKDAPPKEKTREVSQDGKKSLDRSLPEKKTTEVTLLPKQRPQGTPSEKKHQEPSGEEILTPEQQIKYPPEEAKNEEKIIQKEEKDTLKPRKPYKKKAPTEERKPIKQPTIEKKPSSPEQKKTIYLGDIQKMRRRLTEAQWKSPSDENIGKELTDKTSEKKEFTTTVEAPFLEIDIDEAKVYLILPKQQFKANMVDELSRELSYTIEVNGEQQELLSKTTTDREGRVFVEENRILLEKPLLEFQIAFPGEIQGRKYNYNHDDKGLYTFFAIGNNRGRMFYLYDEEGNVNLLPKRVVWILLHEEFECQNLLGSGDITGERWIWERYQPFRVDLNEIDALVINNRISGEEKSFALQSTFRVEGEHLIEDDYKKECPLFTGKTLNISAPYENQSGWSVWIQNKVAGYKIKENWTGREPLTLRLPDDLPCEFGVFQIDICQQNTRIPDETLFFRLMPCIELNYPKELIIPNPKSGHIPLTISIRLDSNDEWELDNRGIRDKVKLKEHNFYEIELPPEEDTFRFILAKTSQPESIVNFQTTVTRLKWKTSKQMTWNGISQKIERRHLETGYPLYLQILTNDFDNKYDLLALLEANRQKLQEGKFIRKGAEYILELNQFFDTIKHNKDELTIRVEIRKMKEEQLVGSVDSLYFEGEPKVPKKIPPQKLREETASKILTIRALVKYPGKSSKVRKGKGFSKKEIIDAGINLKDVRRLKILYDKRRKSSYQWNVDSLKSLIMGGDKYVY
jgi:ribosomal protein L13E